MNLNKVLLIGRLTRDPEMKNLPSGQKVTTFGMATDRFFTGKDGQRQQQTEFHNIVLFGRLAEIAYQYLKKGALTYLDGRLRTRSWQDNAGNKKQRTEIIGENLQMGPRQTGGSPERNVQQPPPAPEPEKTEEIPIIEEEINVKDIPF